MSKLEKVFNLKQMWDSDEDNIGKEVFSPCLEQSVFYRAETGFFSDSFLYNFSEIAISLVEREDYTIELLCSPNIGEYVRQTLEDTLSDVDKKNMIVRQGHNALLAASGFKLNPENTAFRQMLFAHLIAEEKIIIKFGVMNVIDLDDDLLHYKRGYFKFNDDRVIAHTGSGNLTRAGLGTQGNDIQVYKSDIGFHKEVLDFIVKKVDLHWDNKSPKVDVIPVNQETLDIIKQSNHENKKEFKKKLKKSLDKYRKPKSLDVGSISAPDEPEVPIRIPEYVNYETGKWSFQGEAIKAWKENECLGILAMATGSGKTITSMIALSHVIRDNEPLMVVISAKSNALVRQWEKECKTFEIKTLLYKGEKRQAHLWDLQMNLESGVKKLGVVIMTDTTLVMDSTKDALSKINVKKMHIGDEVHNLGRSQFIESPPDFFDYKLGLSATPDRQYDEEGTDELFNYFGNKNDCEKNTPVFEFNLKQAMEAGVLVPYDYHVHEIYLNESELDKYAELTAKISKRLQIVQSHDDDSTLQKWYLARRKILENAEEKILFMKKELDKNRDSINHTLIFASAKGEVEDEYRSDEKQINEINKILNKLDITFHQVTGQETQSSEIETIIKNFKETTLKVLTSMVILDEGVDIPQIRQAYILSSSTVKREWVQRRGRVLRISEGKDKAIIHDFLVLPSHNLGDYPLSNIEKKILKDELTRIQEFADIALNRLSEDLFQTIRKLENLLYID